MKTFAAFLLVPAFALGQPVPKHNVYFPWNSSDLEGSPARVVQSVFSQLPTGKSVRFGIEGPVANHYTDADRNMLTTERAVSICELLEEMGANQEQLSITDLTPVGAKNLVLEVLAKKGRGVEVVPPTFTSLSELLPLHTQRFTIDPRKDNVLHGAQGTLIRFPANTLCDASGRVPSTMEIALTEAYGSGQILRADLHTMCGGKPLESGGTVHLAATTGNQAAQVSPGKEFDLEFPKTGRDDGMEAFYGRTNRNGGFDWVRAARTVTTTSSRTEYYINGKQVSKDEYMAKLNRWKDEERMMDAHAEAARNDAQADAILLKSGQLGWINCDRFIDAGPLTDVLVSVDTSLRPSVRMVFEGMNSAISGPLTPNIPP